MPHVVPATSAAIQQAATILRASGVVAFPTETVYGLGACTFNERAIDLVYTIKGRPADNPLIAHVIDSNQAREIVAAGAWDDRCELLASRFWPGPLTLVLPKSSRVPHQATAGRSTVAVRSPRHPVARSLLGSLGEPVSAPSANRSGRVSPTSAQHVLDEFENVAEARDLIILDGGACEVGIESTVLDVSTAKPRILRHGSVTLEQLRSTIGAVESPDIRTQHASPGTAQSHYAPATRAELIASADLPEILRRYAGNGVQCVALVQQSPQVVAPHAWIAMPRDAATYAHDLYQCLREADAIGADRIIIECPQGEDDLWRAIRDRLRRAAAGG